MTLFLAFCLLLRSERFDSRDVAAHDPHPGGIFELPRGALKAQIELLFLEIQKLLLKLILGHHLEIGQTLLLFHGQVPLLDDPLDETSLDRQLRGGK